MQTVDDLPTPLLIWLRCQFFRIRDLRQLQLRTETRMLYEQLHPQAGPRRVHLLPHWLQRLNWMDPAAVEVLCRQLLELEEPSLRAAARRARELREKWERLRAPAGVEGASRASRRPSGKEGGVLNTSGI